jgi:hypothetical protein
MKHRLNAIRYITLCLSVRDDPDLNARLGEIAASRHLDWGTVLMISDAEFLTPALWVAMKTRHLVDTAPAQVVDYLWKTHLLNTLRNQRIRAQALEVGRRLNAIGVQPLLLKGGVSLFTGTFEDAGIRVMRDLDILVPAKAAHDCWKNLVASGYIPVDRDYDYSNFHHLNVWCEIPACYHATRSAKASGLRPSCRLSQMQKLCSPILAAKRT